MLKSLLESLDINYLVIVEDDFTELEDAREILKLFLLLNSPTRDRLFVELSNGDLLSWLRKLSEKQINKERLEVYGVDAVLHKDEREKINAFEKDLLENVNIFSKYGILNYPSGSNEIYFEIFDDVMSCNNVCINTFNEYSYDKISQTIKNNLPSESKLYIAIVDKIISGDGGHDGSSLIEELLSSDIPAELLSVLFSSSAVPENPQKYNDYFKYQISKSHSSPKREIVHYLALAAYALLFKNLIKSSEKGVKEAEELIFKTPDNIHRILENAKNEGQIPFEVIEKWYSDLFYYFFNEDVTENYDTFKLAQSFYSNFPDGHNCGQTENELNNITSFEIFDYTCNKKHLPISVGDIFKNEKNGKFYVLVGQECDLSLRTGDISRKAGVGIWLEALFSSENQKEKCLCKNDGNNLCISLYPYKNEDQYGTLKIFINKYKTVCFEPLDLCCLNNSGKSSIILEDLNDKKFDYMPTKKEYYQQIYEKLQNIKNIQQTLYINKLELSGQNDLPSFSTYENIKNNGKCFSFPITRIGRLRNEFCRYVNQSYYDQLGRTALNGIFSFTPEVVEEKIKYGVNVNYCGVETIISENEIDVSINAENGKFSCLKEDLTKHIKSQFHVRMNEVNIIDFDRNNSFQKPGISVVLSETDKMVEVKLKVSYNPINKKNKTSWTEGSFKYTQLIRSRPDCEDYIFYPKLKKKFPLLNPSGSYLDTQIEDYFNEPAIIFSKTAEKKYAIEFDKETLSLNIEEHEDE